MAKLGRPFFEVSGTLDLTLKMHTPLPEGDFNGGYIELVVRDAFILALQPAYYGNKRYRVSAWIYEEDEDK